MPTSPDNLDPKETTEAKLCAYLEGDLSPQERAEIERYLEGNPQHRQLLAQLGKTLEMVRSIPRERAPVEIADAFHAQLERSLLLDASESELSGQRYRWPQALMVAAIVALAAGLGVLIYFALPGSGPAPLKYTIAPPSALPASVPSDEAVLNRPDAAAQREARQISALANAGHTSAADQSPTQVADAPKTKMASEAAVLAAAAPQQTNLLALKAVAPGNNEMFRVASSKASVSDSAQTLTEKAFDAKDLDERVARLGLSPMPESIAGSTNAATKADVTAGDAPSEKMYMIVSAGDPAATSSFARDYFARNGMLYVTAKEGAKISESNSPAAAPLEQGGFQVGNSVRAMVANTATSKPSGFVTDNGGMLNSLPQINNGSNVGPITSLAQTTGTENTPVQSLQNSSNGIANFDRGGAMGGNGGSQNGDVSNRISGASAPNPPAANELFVLHGVTSDEAENFSLSLKNTGVPTAVYTSQSQQENASSQPALPVTLPESDLLKKDETLSITVEQLQGPGIDKTSIVRVAEDGTVSLPMVEPVPAAGLSTSDLQAKIAAKYREANLIPDANVKVMRQVPTTRPADMATPTAASSVAATTEPAIPATSQPTTSASVIASGGAAGSEVRPTSQPARRIDVVILIQKANASPRPEPSLAPASAPAATQASPMAGDTLPATQP